MSGDSSNVCETGRQDSMTYPQEAFTKMEDSIRLLLEHCGLDDRSRMESSRSLHASTVGAVRREDRLHRTDGEQSPPWGSRQGLGQAAAQPNVVGQYRDQRMSSDGARGTNPGGESLGVFDRRTVEGNYASMMPATMMCQFTPRTPSFSGNWEEFAQFEIEMINFAKMHGCEEAFVSDVPVPVGDIKRSLESLVAEGYSRRQVESHCWAWQLLCSALKGDDLTHMTGATSPRQVWVRLREWYMPQTQGAIQALYKSFCEEVMSVDTHPVAFITKLEVLAKQLSAKGCVITQSQVFIRFLCALPSPEYERQIEFLSSQREVTRKMILGSVGERFATLQCRHGKNRYKKGTHGGQAFVADRQEKAGGRAGWGNKSGGGKSGFNKFKKGAAPKNSNGAQVSTTSAAASTPTGFKCGECMRVGHKTERCPDHVCQGCFGKGHRSDVCPTLHETTVVAFDEPECSDGEECDAFIAEDFPGEFGMFVDGGRSGELVIGVEEESWISDSGATSHATPSAAHMSSYRRVKETLRIASGQVLPIVGRGNLSITFRTREGNASLAVLNVAHAPELHYNLFSLTRVADAGHKYVGDREGINVYLKTGGVLNMPSNGRLNYLHGSRNDLNASPSVNANAVIAPGSAPVKPTSPVNINVFHCPHGHSFEVNLRKTSAQMGVKLEGELHGCKGCSMHAGTRKPIVRSTSSRADVKLGRAFVDLLGPKPVVSRGGMRYTLFIRDGHTRYTIYFPRKKGDAAESFERWSADERADGIPSEVAI